MASYENLLTEQPWQFRPAFGDAWFSDLFTKETDNQTLTMTDYLQSSFSGNSSNGDVFSAEIVESLFAKPDTTPSQTPTVSGGSENEILVSKQRRGTVPPKGRVAKRKSRGSKRSATTTFITADPANFRQMVQQVTGVRLGGLNEQLPVMNPEPIILGVNSGGEMPTLDTSSFWLDGSASSLSQPSTAADNGGSAAAEHYFDSFCSFPTLESWKAM
ncbi:hypothetical protein DH2020_014004 [Rehmannia glutinosa]|uniref:VQ domain-containing protein n=1 Tax=Rehmannia glutinosa TaxID=99300 RepID=A0ABR0WYN6_REHGL